jgi:predicted RNase H-like HicB family nuclease
MKPPTYVIRAEWDEEAKVWVASSDDVPGLATEAESLEQLMERLRVIVPELLEANGLITDTAHDIPIELLAERKERLRLGTG